MKQAYYKIHILIYSLFLLCISFQGRASAGSDPAITENIITPTEIQQPRTLWPNRAGKTLTVPSGWGASWGVIFIGASITDPAAYSKNRDAAISFGLGLGNPVTNIGIQLSPTIWDVSRFDNLSLSCKIHRYLGNASSLAVGAENLFADKDETDTEESYYIVISHAFQQFHAHEPDHSSLHASIGVGSGRFGEKSPLDIQTGKGKHGSYVFGSLAYEVFPSINMIVDWNGLNLNVGISLAPLKEVPVGITLGIADFTGNSGDGARFISSAGIAYLF